ncbi:hypothetical protein D4A47_05875 [Anaerotruncus massiliensis (ex Liu et al. 2021)]|uniref:Uncharacterized protein n=1 Tax=Anaerotruncus massiliensis (ex Liu et al. 2021) TaxID=2321404 RepID=A0A498CNN2_9FIRM|nr:hypothetical protein D4A47_05875 [Anaerotruncus massiliensis (ex Liu et al. 2021)]
MAHLRKSDITLSLYRNGGEISTCKNEHFDAIRERRGSSTCRAGRGRAGRRGDRRAGRGRRGRRTPRGRRGAATGRRGRRRGW